MRRKFLANGMAFFGLAVLSSLLAAPAWATTCPSGSTLLADPWCHLDVGGPFTVPGSATYSSGTFTVNGTGTNIYQYADGFHYVFQSYTGDFEFVTKFESLSQPLYSEPLGGVMVRESVAADSRFVFAYQVPAGTGPGSGAKVGVEFRSLNGGYTENGLNLQGLSFGRFLRYVRVKDEITLYVSSDGVTWTWIDGVNLINLPSTVLVGMAVVSEDANNISTGIFTNVSLKPPTLPYQTSWIANTLPGALRSVQQNTQGMYVDPANGKMFLDTFWDEAAEEASMYDTNGSILGTLTETHAWSRYGGSAVTSDGTYAYLGMEQHHLDGQPAGGYPDANEVWYCVRRYAVDGKPAPFTGPNIDPNTNPGTAGGYDGSLKIVSRVTDHVIRGLSIDAGTRELYVSDTMANTINVYNANSGMTMNLLRSFPVASPYSHPRGSAIDSNHNLWLIADANGVPAIVHYGPNGNWLGPDIAPSGWDPSAITVDGTGVLWVADKGPDMQIKKFNSSGTQIGTFGNQGGVFSGTKGLVGPLKLNTPVGVGVDYSGNVWVAGDLGGRKAPGGTELRKFDSSGNLLWERYGLVFRDAAGVDPTTDGKDLYTVQQHFTMDYSKPTGQQWTYKGVTLDPNYHDDLRLQYPNSGGLGGTFIRYKNGSKFMFVTTEFGVYLGIYRFAANSEIAIPSGLMTRQTYNLQWPANFPGGAARLIWRDIDGNGSIDPNNTEYITDSPSQYSLYGWYVDANMDVWTTNSDPNQPNPISEPLVRRYRCLGLDTAGNPKYDGTNIDDYAYASFNSDPDPNYAITQVNHAIYIPATDTMYLGLYSKKNDYLPGSAEFAIIGHELRRYNNWVNGPRTIAWKTVIPYGGTYHSAHSMDVAGNRVYVVMMDTAETFAYDTATGALIKTFTPGPEIGGEAPFVDVPEGLTAFQRGNGDYLVFVQDDLDAKNILYQEPTAPLYYNAFGGATSPFTVSNNTGGSTTVVSIGGNNAVQFQDTTGNNNKNTASLFTLHITSDPLLTRFNDVYRNGTLPVSFDLSFTLERTLASSRPLSGGITGALQLNKSAGGSIQITGSPEPSIYGTLAYSHDETAPNQYLERADRFVIATYRFTITPNGIQNYLSSVDFRFQAQVDATPNGQPATTPEAYLVDDLTITEVRP
ncbi:MAG: hypothetical protein HY049_08375 [Acidobacteria bacterium]|nr:hypothetical protein [Acidobacteriota bacterium]